MYLQNWAEQCTGVGFQQGATGVSDLKRCKVPGIESTGTRAKVPVVSSRSVSAKLSSTENIIKEESPGSIQLRTVKFNVDVES
jgi:hypothetical protein